MKEREKKIYSFVAGHAKRVPAIGITPALSLLYGHCPPLFCYIFFTTLMDSGASPRIFLREWWTWMIRLLPVILSAIWMLFFRRQGVVAHYSNVTDARIAMQEGKNLRVLLSPQRVYRQRHKANGSQRSLSIPLLIPDCRLSIVQGYENDGRTHLRAAARTMLYAKGATEDQAMAYLQPIVLIHTH